MKDRIDWIHECGKAERNTRFQLEYLQETDLLLRHVSVLRDIILKWILKGNLHEIVSYTEIN
jgi:hypothetical protein